MVSPAPRTFAIRPDHGLFGKMQLHGSIADNLNAALLSVRRLRGHSVQLETLRYWQRLLDHARRSPADASPEPEVVAKLIGKLETQLADRLPRVPPTAAGGEKH